MKLFYSVLALFILLIWSGVFDPQPSGELSLWRPIPAETAFALRTIDDQLTVDASSPLTIAIDPVGYVGIWQLRAGERIWLRQWQTWPHLRERDNEIWLDWEDGKMTVWINQELLWKDVAMSLDCPCEVGSRVEVFLR